MLYHSLGARPERVSENVYFTCYTLYKGTKNPIKLIALDLYNWVTIIISAYFGKSNKWD